MGFTDYSGLLGLVVLALDIGAIVPVAGSGASTGGEIAGILAILILPILSLLARFRFGPRPVVRRP